MSINRSFIDENDGTCKEQSAQRRAQRRALLETPNNYDIETKHKNSLKIE